VSAWNGRALTYLDSDDEDHTLFYFSQQDAAKDDEEEDVLDAESDDGSDNPFDIATETDGLAELATLYFP